MSRWHDGVGEGMETQATDEAARLLAEARLGRTRFAGLPDGRRPADEAEAYAIQEALHRRLEDAGRGPVVGYKIGCTTPVMQRFLGIDSPCAGGVLALPLARQARRSERARSVQASRHPVHGLP